MNANEVIATLASRRRLAVHPNDHVNASQSSNDVFPTADPPRRDRGASSRSSSPRSPTSRSRWSARRTSSPTSSRPGARTSWTPRRSPSARSSAGMRLRSGTRVERLEAVLPRVAELPLGGTAVGTGHQHAGGVRREGDRASSSTSTGLPLREAREPLRGAGRARRPRRGVRRAADRGGQPLQDLQRPALDGFRAARRTRRDPHPGPAAGLLDHARQGQPGHLRGDDDGLRAGHRQRPGGRLLRHGGATSSSTS